MKGNEPLLTTRPNRWASLPPIAAKAETYWLVLRAGIFNGSSLEKIEMKDMNHCESEGKRWKSSEVIGKPGDHHKDYLCITGK